MPDVCFYFQVHQPYRIKKYNIFNIGKTSDYFDHKKNAEVMQKVARKCYIPTNNVIRKLIDEHGQDFKVSYSITGTALEQFEKYTPEVIHSFQDLADTGCVEFLNETYYHSLSYFYSKDEFRHQVDMHRKIIKELFGQKPKVFRNTELIYNNEIAKTVEDMGYDAIIAEGADHVLGWRSPNYIYKPVQTNNIRLLLKNYKLSDDIAFRFSNKDWKDYPLSAEKFASWASSSGGDALNLFMDYETFGEHQWEYTGIFKFLRQMPKEILKHSNMSFKTPSELSRLEPVAELDIHSAISWADMERDLSAWLGNSMQHSAINQIYKLAEKIHASGDHDLINSWRKLTTSDHFYYMCVKWFSDGDVHKYFNPFSSPYESYISYMNILNDLDLRSEKISKKNDIPTKDNEKNILYTNGILS